MWHRGRVTLASLAYGVRKLFEDCGSPLDRADKAYSLARIERHRFDLTSYVARG
jgi:hypothetical protein